MSHNKWRVLRESNSRLLVVPMTLVDPARIELASPRCKRGVLPLYQGPKPHFASQKWNFQF